MRIATDSSSSCSSSSGSGGGSVDFTSSGRDNYNISNRNEETSRRHEFNRNVSTRENDNGRYERRESSRGGGRSQPCFKFQTGNCTYGSSCKFYHDNTGHGRDDIIGVQSQLKTPRRR